ncbi:MAG: NADP-dependent oxidoreductase [Novosphingobium sp.]|uniref:NADP-dependent oxidoreductase n=1 Tax=Novosphingobium sp. TaxID=1874826 RepID=UPI003018002C
MPHTNRRVFLRQYREGLPLLEDFGIEDVEITSVPEGHALVRVDTLSMDAWIRTTLTPGSFHETADLGSTIRALGVGQVVESASDALVVGDWVFGPLSAQTHALMPAAALTKLDLSNSLQPRDFVGPLGLTTGLTAWVGLIAVAEVKAGDVVLVSGAAGAVGSMVVQLAKAHGARVIGIAGGPEKGRFVTEKLGADYAIDYKAGHVDAELRAAAPGGIDVFFDNVGGELLDIALDNLAPANARIAICGAISQYSDLGNVRGPRLYLRLAERNAMMKGFVVTHYAARFGEAKAEIAALMRDGKVNLPEHVVEGIDHFAEALLMLFAGGHTGNLLVQP